RRAARPSRWRPASRAAATTTSPSPSTRASSWRKSGASWGNDMTSDRPKSGLVARVRDNTRKYIEELLRENVRLRAAVDRIGGESKTLRSQLDQLRGDLDRREEQHARLLQLLGAAEEQTRVFEDRFSEVESQNAS